MLTLHCPPDQIFALADFLREKGAEAISVSEIDYVFTQENPLFETLKAGARPYPMVPTMGLLHTALGDNLIEYLQGRESAQQALADATKAYETSAREAGFLN